MYEYPPKDKIIIKLSTDVGWFFPPIYKHKIKLLLRTEHYEYYLIPKTIRIKMVKKATRVIYPAHTFRISNEE
jgi:hypothetical protein